MYHITRINPLTEEHSISLTITDEEMIVLRNHLDSQEELDEDLIVLNEKLNILN